LVLLALAAFACFFGALSMLKWAGLLSTEIASWVQAIGSIAAIIGAFSIASAQVRHAKERREQEEHSTLLERSNFAVAIAVDAASAVRDSTRVLVRHEAGAVFCPEVDLLEEALTAIRALLAHRCPDDMAISILRLRRILVFSIRALRQREGWELDFKSATIEGAERRALDAKEIVLDLARMRNAVRRQRDN
jgi:hypothetical protein